jgi:cysteine desulfuration protein SufE
MRQQDSDINVRQDEVIREFEQLTDWEDRYEYLIDMGKTMPVIDQRYKTESYLVKGCQSNVWLHGELRDDRLYLEADSDALITKGIIALLIRVLSGQPATEIRDADLYFIERIGLNAHLSPTRSNGLRSMITHIKSFATHLRAGSNGHDVDTSASYRDKIIEEIKQVYDPEIPVDIWELGLIYTLDVQSDGKVNIDMTLTSPACPVAGSLPMEVQERVMALDFVRDVELKLVWTPAWTKEKMSDEARMALDMF